MEFLFITHTFELLLTLFLFFFNKQLTLYTLVQLTPASQFKMGKTCYSMAFPSTLAFILFNILLCLPSLLAQNATISLGGGDGGGNSTNNSTTGDVSRGVLRTDATAIITLIILVLIGLAYCFFGFSLFKPTLFVAGFFLGASLTMMALVRADAFGHSDLSRTSLTLIYYSISAAVGLIAGCIFLCCWQCGIYVIGMFGGYILAKLIISAIPTELSTAVRVIIIVVFVILGGLLLHFFEKPIVIGATSFSGAYIAMFGVDSVLNRGIAYDAYHSTAPNHDSLYEVIAVVVLGIIGVIYQSMRYAGAFGGKERGIPDRTEKGKAAPHH